MNRLLLYNLRVYDPSRRLSYVRAILISNGLIARLYTRTPRLVKDVERIDVHGQHVMPGFIDSHTHLISRGLELQNIDLGSCTSLHDCLDTLRTRRRDYQVVIGFNWDESTWQTFKPTMLTRHVLDTISKSKPVIMRRVCGHCAVVNTAALRKIPRSRKIVDRTTGWLYEDAALYLNDIFKPDAVMKQRAVELGIQEAVCHGITSIHEIGDLNRLALLQHAKRAGMLRIRVAFYVLLQDMHKIVNARIESGFGDDFLKCAGIKIFMDGSIGARTAALSRPYHGSSTRGKVLITQDRLARIVKQAEKNNLQLMIHTIGDRTTSLVLAVLNKTIDNNKLRHRLEHIELVKKRDIDTIACNNLIASMQPNFVRRWQQPGGMYEECMGKRYKRLNAFRSIYDAGIRLAFGSDCMPLGPLYGIPGACEHPFPDGRISRSVAFRAYSRGGAFASREEHKKGQIREGMAADLVVVNDNPMAVKSLDSLQIIRTIVAGKSVYTRST